MIYVLLYSRDLEEALEMGMDWSLREGYAWAEDKEHCEEYGRMLNADPSKVSLRAKKRGLPQLGTLGAGNHYAEIQVVDEIYDKFAAKVMGLEEVGQVVVMIHSGSRGLGHQVRTFRILPFVRPSFLMEFLFSGGYRCACPNGKSHEARQDRSERSSAGLCSHQLRRRTRLSERHGLCGELCLGEPQQHDFPGSSGTYQSPIRTKFRKSVDVNRFNMKLPCALLDQDIMTLVFSQAFAKVFESAPDDLDMQVIYDVSHNIAKFEEHIVCGQQKTLLVHRKGSTRAFPPHHPLIPVDYQITGQPVLIGGTMGTCSYVLTGTEQGKEPAYKPHTKLWKLVKLSTNAFPNGARFLCHRLAACAT